MYLKSLELTGFKSFAKKSLLVFSAPVTSVVGPNGSGKSNVVEAIRFVLGEQSMKSLRGKSGSDLIFKGSKFVSKLNRASVTITFDNSKKIFAISGFSNDAIKLDYDEISITREVYADGENKYLINGSEVRLKDIHELVARVNIGASGHHIISQGEADRVLTANARERKSMVEDALGLRVYHFRLKESEKKLERTKLNIKEAQSLRREIAPHITFLRKQVEKLHKAEEMREELDILGREYLKAEEIYIKNEKDALLTDSTRLKKEINIVESKINTGGDTGSSIKKNIQIEIENLEKEILNIRNIYEELSRKLGRVEGMIEWEENNRPKEEKKEISVTFDRNELNAITTSMMELIDRALSSTNLSDITNILNRIKVHILDISKGDKDSGFSANQDVFKEEKLKDLKRSQNLILDEIKEIKHKESRLYEDLNKSKSILLNEEEKNRTNTEERFSLIVKKNELINELSIISIKLNSLEEREKIFTDEIRELSAIVGASILRYKDFVLKDDMISLKIQEDRHKKIERLKIKIEDTGGVGGSEVIKEYQEVSERDSFLSREIDDLEKSIVSIKDLIHELKEKLDKEFKIGIEKINKQFQNFFSLMFGGGTAFLSVIVEQKRKYKKDEEEIEEIEEENPEGLYEQGIEINISLPQKKVKELTMLSGGERSLTSIALLFAISQVNPPPFLVLDETDAALDEANSRKYGDMIETLAKYSQLIVVTHNRETMSRANVLYGVTLGADGGSKLLSVKFEEAVAIAK